MSMVQHHVDETSVWSRWRAHRLARATSSRVRHRASDAIAVMLFSAALSGVLALVLTGVTWWITRAGQ